MEDNYREVKKAEPCLKLIHMDQVEVEEIEWLFYPFIQYGREVGASRINGCCISGRTRSDN